MPRVGTSLISIALILILLVGCAPAVEEIPTATTPAISDTPQVISSPRATLRPTESIFPDPSEGRIPVIFSHGGGPCDIGAVIYLSKYPNVDLIGMVLSRGEIHPENALNAWGVFLYDVLHSRDTAIALGTDERIDPNSHDFPEAWRGAADNFWGLALPQAEYKYEVAAGPELIVELVNASPDKVTIVAMASMIDVARALQIDPGIIDNIAHVVIMGGAFTVPGNLNDDPTITENQAAEWNMWIDSEAARYLFNSGVRVSIVPLDAIQYLVQPDDVAIMNAIDDPAVRYTAQNWSDQIGMNPGGFLIWDTITIVAVTNPEFFDWTYDGVDVITEAGAHQGQTIALNNGATHTRYATGADYEAIMDQIFTTFRSVTQAMTITELGGTWEGSTGVFHITFVLDPVCELNVKCGSFEIPEFSLTGDITFVDIDGDKYEFKATNLSSGEPSGALYEYLQIMEDGTLRYVTTGPDSINEAILTRK
jgi:pyrimidine-specific ribonucleoside hydrolase